jgi:hypothetical protein
MMSESRCATIYFAAPRTDYKIIFPGYLMEGPYPCPADETDAGQAKDYNSGTYNSV